MRRSPPISAIISVSTAWILVAALTGCATRAPEPILPPEPEAAAAPSPTREERIHQEWHRYHRLHGVPPAYLEENEYGLIFTPPPPESI